MMMNWMVDYLIVVLLIPLFFSLFGQKSRHDEIMRELAELRRRLDALSQDDSTGNQGHT
jgi:hypothetical protein